MNIFCMKVGHDLWGPGAESSVLNVCVFTKFICWNPNPQGDGIKRQGPWAVFGSWEHHLRELDSCPYKGDPREIPRHLCNVKWQWEEGHLWGCGPSPCAMSADAWIWEFPASSTAINTSLLFISHPIRGVSLQQPKQTKTPSCSRCFIFSSLLTTSWCPFFALSRYNCLLNLLLSFCSHLSSLSQHSTLAITL